MLIKGKQIRDATIEQRNLNLSMPLNPTDAATKEYVDLHSGSTKSSVERYSDKNLEMTANPSNGVNGFHLATNIPLLDQPTTGSGVNVYINGIQSNKMTFFARKDSNDQPILPIRDFGEEQLGDYCFFNTVTAQYELTTDDIIDFMYIISDVSEGTAGEPGFGTVDSVFGRTGDIVAHYGDYTADQIAYSSNTGTNGNIDNVQSALDDIYTSIENIPDGITGDIYADQVLYLAGTNGTSGIYNTVQDTIDDIYTSIENIPDGITGDIYADQVLYLTGTTSGTSGTSGTYDNMQNIIDNISTDDVSEGISNLYYTDDRVETKVQLLSINALNDVDTSTKSPNVNDALLWNGSAWVPGFVDNSTSGEMLKEVYDPTGIHNDTFDYNNFYNTPYIPQNTNDLPEGTNGLYYTDERVDNRISVASINDLSDVLTNGTNGTNGIPIDYVLKWNGTYWIPLSENVLSVFNRSGDIKALYGDYSADLITYDNSTSGINSTNVQTALDEVYAEARYTETDIYSLEYPAGTAGNTILTYNVDLSLAKINKIYVPDGIEALEFTLSFTSDSNIKSREVLVMIDNTNNTQAINTILFNDNSGQYTWRWSIGVKPSSLVAGVNAALYVYNVSNTEVKASWEVEE